MNKEVNYVWQGFLLTLALLGTSSYFHYLHSLPDRASPPQTQEVLIDNSSSQKTVANNSNGKALFQTNCASCHSIKKVLTGPALAGVLQRIPDRKIIYKWVHNPPAVLKSGDPYFNGLKKKFDNLVMTAFPELSNADIDAILEYLELKGAMEGTAVY